MGNLNIFRNMIKILHIKNLWDKAKVQFVENLKPQICILEEKRLEANERSNELSTTLRQEKKQQNRSKESRRKALMMTRVEIKRNKTNIKEQGSIKSDLII